MVWHCNRVSTDIASAETFVPMNRGAVGVLAIDHITIACVDMARTRGFYVDVLGMKPVARPDFGFPGYWFQAGGTQIHLIEAGERGGRPGVPYTGSMTPSQGFHFAFRVADVQEAAARLVEYGLEVIDGPRARPDGVMQAYVWDPDGYLIEVCDT